MTHDQLQEDLAAHLRGNTDRMVWTNTQLGPVGSPRPDLTTIMKSFSRFRADCYEIKVSVSDLRSDITKGKWQSYRKFSHAVWFAFPKGMAPLDLIPKECGVILRSDSGWRAARKPVAQVLDTLPRDAWLKLLMEEYEDASPVKKPRYGHDWIGERIVREKLGDRLADLFRDVGYAESHLRDAKVKLEAKRASLDADLKAIDAQKEERRKLAESDAARIGEALDESMRALGVALGIPEADCGARTLLNAIDALRARMQGGGIEQAITLLQGLQGILPANDPSIYRRRW